MARYSRPELEAMLYAAAARYGIDQQIAYRQIQQESGFNPDAVSNADPPAVGIAQFIPATAARFGLRDRLDPAASLEAWGQYMRLLLDMFGGRYDLALAGYNSGENRSEYKAAAREGRCINWSIFTGRLIGLQTETRPYVNRILGMDCSTGATPAAGIIPPAAGADTGPPGSSALDFFYDQSKVFGVPIGIVAAVAMVGLAVFFLDD